MNIEECSGGWAEVGSSWVKKTKNDLLLHWYNLCLIQHNFMSVIVAPYYVSANSIANTLYALKQDHLKPPFLVLCIFYYEAYKAWSNLSWERWFGQNRRGNNIHITWENPDIGMWTWVFFLSPHRCQRREDNTLDYTKLEYNLYEKSTGQNFDLSKR